MSDPRATVAGDTMTRTLSSRLKAQRRDAFMGGLNCPFEPDDSTWQSQEAQADHYYELWKLQYDASRQEPPK